ncbi:MAG: VOC family protein [Bryobacteraceae bacterium]|jgi:catechol 2,3-dioxygenase-like lactoylglutathione lyase family enzyme
MLPRVLCFAVIACPLMAQQFHIDHVTVAGKNVDAMINTLRDVAGITAQYGGPHSNHATEMALASFPDGSYLELIAIQPKADPAALAAHYWHKFMEADAGPCAWAIRPPDFSGEVERLRKAGVSVTDARRAGRKRPDGVDLDWETAQVGPTNGGFFPFMIHDFTPRDNRAYPSGKPSVTDWTGVVKVVIEVQDLDAAIARYRKAYGLPVPQRQDDAIFGAKLAWFPGTPVVLAAPINSSSWLSARLQRYGEVPCAFIFGAQHGVAGYKGSTWFGYPIVWADSDRLGWHLGFAASGG